MDNVVIVAIPDENDPVWEVSSEKAPHLTLCYLGENVANLNEIVGFVQHAASTMLNRFFLSVDHRGKLGEDEADVLFFKKDPWDYQRVWAFRSALLKNNAIRTAYDSAQQFDGEWQPHLTLGYPETPAKNQNGSRFYNIGFNKIAVWTGDFEGPEFLLEEEDWQMSPMTMSEKGAEFLEHFGVKGMRWGVRKEEVHPDIADVPAKTRKEASKDAEEFTRAKLFYGEGAGTRRKLVKAKVETKKSKDQLYAKAFDHFVKQTDLGKRAVQARKERKRTDVKKSTKKTARGVGNVLRGRSQYANTAAVVGVGVGTHLYKKHVQQSDEQEGAMTQTADSGREFLDHHGVKGMQWGVRKENVNGAVKSVGKAAKATGRFAGDVEFEARLKRQGSTYLTNRADVERKIHIKAKQEFRKNDLAGIKERHGDYAKLRNRAKKPFSKEARAYRKDARETYIKRLEESANSMTNTSGTRQYTIRERGYDLPSEGGALPASKHFWDVTSREIKHADGDFTFTLEVVEDDGYITDLQPVEPEMAQTADLGAEFLEHYGIKGMQWGVRRASAVTTQTHIDTGLRRRRTKVVAKGGEAHDAHPDAVVAAVQKQKLKKSGTDALSTNELRQLANRLQLETQVETLSTNKGKKFVARQLEETGKQQVQRGIGKGVTHLPRVGKKVKKGAATLGVAAALL